MIRSQKMLKSKLRLEWVEEHPLFSERNRPDLIEFFQSVARLLKSGANIIAEKTTDGKTSYFQEEERKTQNPKLKTATIHSITMEFTFPRGFPEGIDQMLPSPPESTQEKDPVGGTSDLKIRT